jgi:glycerol-1-phosphate dehydrogenase [NAD(P)+]
VAFLRCHGLPVLPADIGLDDEQLAQAVLLASSTRPGRYTILEHLDLGAGEVTDAVNQYVAEPMALPARWPRLSPRRGPQ